MKVLVVGAGSVGQVLAHHLIKGGCEVTFLVKDARVEKLSEHNPRVHWLSMLMPRRGEEKDEVVEGYKISSWGGGEWKREVYDVIYITTDATATRQGTWMSDLTSSISAQNCSTILCYPSFGTFDNLGPAASLHRERLVAMAITFIAWETPLLGEKSPSTSTQGVTAYVTPDSFVLGGPSAKIAAYPLSKGGLLCKCVATREEVSLLSALPDALLMPFLLVLESSGWSFSQVRRSGKLGLLARAVRECSGVMCLDLKAPWTGFLAACLFRRCFMWLLLLAAPHIFPFDLEAYLKHHFTKVGNQTKALVDSFIDAAGKAGTPSGATKALASANVRWRK